MAEFLFQTEGEVCSFYFESQSQESADSWSLMEVCTPAQHRRSPDHAF